VFETLLALTALIIVMTTWHGYRHTQDALMPLVVFAPMLAYAYVYSPAMLLYHGQLERFFPESAPLEYVALVNLVGVGLFCFGCVRALSATRSSYGWSGVLKRFLLDERTQARIFHLSCLFGLTAVGAFVYLVTSAGGVVNVFSHPKAYLPSASGYISEMRMLAYPAILLLAISLRGSQIRSVHVLLALLFASPHLMMASLGGRRGPAFLIICTLLVSWYLARNRRPSLRSMITTIGVLGALMLFLLSNRHNIYIGSNLEIDTDAFVEALAVEEGTGGQEFIYSSGLILTAEHFDQFYWGLRYFSLLFVRPVPKQLWPTKYEDMGLGWMVNEPGTGGFSDWDWLDAVGFLPYRGSAGGFVADMFVEFWWFGVVVCFLIGWLYGYCWRKSILLGQLWSVVYLELLALSVYLPAQSVGAWLHRALLLVVPTWFVWTRLVLPMQKRVRPFHRPEWQSARGRT